MKDLIESVAKGLGWDKGAYWLIGPAGACCPYESTDGFSLIVFSAYAKAEMAKRGWEWDVGRWGDGVAIGLRMSEEKDYRYPYDPNDPISEANAVLMCIAQCLQSDV